MTLDDLITLARRAQGDDYADLLRAEIEIAKRAKSGQPIPQAWWDKWGRMDRELRALRARFEREREKARREFWRGS